MSEVKRYDEGYIPSPVCSEYGIIEDTKGDYVLYSDYEAKEAECNRLGNKVTDLLNVLQEYQETAIEKIEKLTAINKTLLDACEAVYNYNNANYEIIHFNHNGYKDIYDAVKSAIQEAKTGGLK